jgi:prepilin-type N-terminal cleavage/methylation domain-containing protein
MPKPHPTRPRRRGFSLVELMAATTVLSLLAIMAIPYAQTAKDREQEVQLLDSLTRIRAAIELYAWNEKDSVGDNDGDGVAEEDPAGDPDGDGIRDDDRDGRVDEDGPPNYPTLLQDLVTRGYLSSIPPDPFQVDKTAPTTWTTLTITREARWTDETGAQTRTVSSGIFDVKSSSPGTALNGSKYADW